MKQPQNLEDRYCATGPTLVVRGRTQRQNDIDTLKELINRYGDNLPAIMNEAQCVINADKAHEEILATKRRLKGDAERAERARPINKFIGYLRNRTAYPEAFDEFSSLSQEDTQQLFDEFTHLAAMRGLALEQGAIDHGIALLNSLRLKNSGNEKPTLRSRFGI